MTELRFAIYKTGFWSHFQRAAWQGKGEAETTAGDNLKTLERVFGAGESARADKMKTFPSDSSGRSLAKRGQR